jgi:hypothetical protein
VVINKIIVIYTQFMDSIYTVDNPTKAGGIVVNPDGSRIGSNNIGDYQMVKCSPGVFVAGTNTHGDHDGTGASLKLFDVTGDVMVRIFGVVTTDLAGASAQISVGTTLSAANLIALTTGTDLDAGELWHDATPDNNVELATVAPDKIIVNGADIYEKTATASLTGGQIYYICLWRPLSAGASVVSAI